MRVLGSYAFMQLCSLAGQSGHSVSAGEKCNRLGAHLLTACHTVHLNPPPLTLPRHSLAPAACRCLSGCLPVPFRLLAGALVAYLYSCLLFSGCLPAPPPPAYLMAAYLVLPAACRAVRLLAGPLRLLAFLLGCLPGLKAAFPLCGLLALPGSSGAARSPLAHCLCLLVSLSCVVRRLVFSVVYLLSIAAAPARRACSPASPDEFVSRSSSPVV